MYLYQVQQLIEEVLEDYKNQLPEPNVNRPQLIQNAVAFTYEHLFDQRLTVRWVKQHFYLKGVPLFLSFNFHMGKTLQQFWTEHRMEAAKILLKDEVLIEASVGDIAFNVGYRAPSTFSTAFRKYTGYSATDFREREIELSQEIAVKV